MIRFRKSLRVHLFLLDMLATCSKAGSTLLLMRTSPAELVHKQPRHQYLELNH